MLTHAAGPTWLMEPSRPDPRARACVCVYSAKEWDDVDKAEKERIELIKREDGEFW